MVGMGYSNRLNPLVVLAFNLQNHNSYHNHKVNRQKQWAY